MNAADLPPELAQPATPGLIDAVRTIAQGSLAGRAYAIDRGAYPVDLLRQLAATGAMSAHLDKADGTPGDYGLAILAMAEAAKVCGATGFMMWCQCVAGLYMQTSGNPGLIGERLARHARGDTLGGTGLSNPMKSFAQIESLLLKATPVAAATWSTAPCPGSATWRPTTISAPSPPCRRTAPVPAAK